MSTEAPRQPPAVEAALPGASATPILDNPVIAAALATPATARHEEWIAKYEFPVEGSITASG